MAAARDEHIVASEAEHVPAGGVSAERVSRAEAAAEIQRALLGLIADDFAGPEIAFVQDRRILRTELPAAEALAGALGAIAGTAAEIGEARGQPARPGTVDLTRTAALLMSPLLQFPLFGNEIANVNAELNSLTGFFRTREGRWIFLHGGFPKTTERLSQVLGVSRVEPLGARRFRRAQRAAARAVEQWDGDELEEAIARVDAIGALARTREEWRAHPQGSALTESPLIEFEPLDETPPVRLPREPAGAPLTGIRVLDLTRVVAGPYGSRVLAQFGADVLRVQSPGQPSIKWFDIDSSHGKRGAWLDLSQGDDLRRFFELVEQADVVVQSYRPGCFERFGITPARLAAVRPGLIFVSINCYGFGGPWQNRGGWEQLAQTVTGMAWDHGRESGVPELVLPIMPVDMLTAHLAALGVVAALLRRHRAGGSWHVKVSLARTAMWLLERSERQTAREFSDGDVMSLPALRGHLLAPRTLLSYVWNAAFDRSHADIRGLGFQQRVNFHAVRAMVDWLGFSAEEAEGLFTISETSYGRLRHLRPAVWLGEDCGSAWGCPPAPPSRDNPRWTD